MPSLRESLHQGAAAFEAAGVEAPRLAAEALLARLLGRERAWLYAHPEDELTGAEAARWEDWVRRRAGGEPPQYITGVAEFYGREFAVSPAVLIPRPETELLVEAALERVGEEAATRIVDVGTGSGCIAITLALERPRAKVVAVDRSAAALAVARVNAAKLGAQVEFVESDLLEGSADPFDLIVSNPPYVSDAELPTLAREVREHEPRAALIAGPRGDEVYRRLIPQAAEKLLPGGWLVLELGYQSAAMVRPLLAAAEWGEVEIKRDTQGWERVAAAQRGHADVTGERAVSGPPGAGAAAVEIRPERGETAELAAIHAVEAAAFGRADEADLVDRLRAEGFALVSLVAVRAGEIVGHILFSRMWVDTASGRLDAVALAPVAVLPAEQKRGIGGALIRRGLELLRDKSERIVIVVGHDDYYPRFGFSQAAASGLESPFPPEAFMAMELSPGALDGVRGQVVYPPPFGV